MLADFEDLCTRQIDTMGREDLVDVLLKYKDCFRTEVTSQWLGRQSTESLRILVLGFRLYRALKQQAASKESTAATT